MAALPEKKILRTELRTFLFNKVWPAFFFWFWTPLVPMVTLKIWQHIQDEEWEDMLERMHMYFFGCNTLYMAYAYIKTSKFYKNAIDLIEEHFLACEDFGLEDLSTMIILWIITSSSFLFCVLGSIYYNEVLVPVWLPFIDNDQPLPLPWFVTVWVYQGVAGVYMVIAYGFVSPFVIVSTMIIVKEINYLINKISNLQYDENDNRTSNHLIYTGNNRTIRDVTIDSNIKKHGNMHDHNNFEYKMNYLEDTKRISNYNEDLNKFINNFAVHHENVLCVIREVSKIHHYIFLTQALFTICHSCFLIFNMYYTERLIKIIVKTSPILLLSLYMLYIYCWNGQRLTDKCDELFRALYCCQWYNCPRNFKSSLIIMMQFCHRPVRLTGGGFITASYETFLYGVQQSISYILLLKQLTPEKQ